METWATLDGQSKKYYDASPHRLHSLVDVTKCRTLPTGIIRVRSAQDLHHPRRGIMAIAGAHPYVQTIANVVLKLGRYDRAKFFQTVDEALVFLRQVVAEESALKDR
jgi:hypothetical protein